MKFYSIIKNTFFIFKQKIVLKFLESVDNLPTNLAKTVFKCLEEKILQKLFHRHKIFLKYQY